MSSTARLRVPLLAFAVVACSAAPSQTFAQAATPAATKDSLDDGLARGTHQTFSAIGTVRSYRVGDTRVTERLAPLSWRLVSPRVALRVSGTPVQLDAPGATLAARTPVTARADAVLRVGDTLSFYGRTASSPGSLSPANVAAIGATGTSVLDLESAGLGAPARLGVRGIMSFPVATIVLGIAGAVEREPTPGGSGAVYWQGTTARGELTISSLLGDRTLTAGADLSYSAADSLGGRNQFPGGGAAGVSLSLAGPLRATSATYVIADAFYTAPFANTRSDQPTRLIPSGAFGGVSGTLIVGTGRLTWSPTVSLLHESSHADVVSQQGTLLSRTTLSGSAWSAAGGIGLDIPIGVFTLSPEVGAVTGRVTSHVQQTNGRVIGRRGRLVGATSSDGFSDAVRGTWGGVGISARF